MSLQTLAQDSTLHFQKPVNFKSRQWLVGAINAAGYGGSFFVLSQAWYNDYAKQRFHTFDDSREWLQVDKIGHSWTTYHTSRLNTAAWRWAGVNHNTAVALGTGTSLLYMAGIGYLDGRSAKWGWSWSDLGANVFGASLFALQEVTWKEQRISLEFSAFPKQYNAQDLQERADDLFGRSFQGKLLKDYNAQTYWLSANLKSFLQDAPLPDWLNVSVGYGADGMYGGFENKAVDANGATSFDRRDIKRFRQWYLAPDVDFSKIKTRSKFLRTLFTAANVLKFPTPALELFNGKIHVKALAF